MADDLITISSCGLTARINPLGAELWSLADAGGAEYMTNADPAFWTGHAPVLFPIVGMVRDGHYRLDGQEYAIPKHGVARGAKFRVTSTGPGFAHFQLVDSAETRTHYPFAFALDLHFWLVGNTLQIAATVCNRGRCADAFQLRLSPRLRLAVAGWRSQGCAPACVRA